MINLNTLEYLYPLTFRIDGGSITFSSMWDGVSDTGVKSEYTARDFAETHNNINPENDEGKPFYIPPVVNDIVQTATTYGCVGKIPTIQLLGRGCRVTVKFTECAIEDMPIGSQIVGIQRDEDEWDVMKINVRRIEVHDDLIVLLAHHSMHGVGYGAEVNIKRGTLVRYTKG